DAYGVGVVVSAGAGSVVEVGCPGVGVAGVAGEVAGGVSEVFVAGPAKAHGAHPAGLSGGGCDAGQARQGVGGGELRAAVADLTEQPCGAHAPGPGQGGEGVGVGGGGQLLVDLGREGLELGDQGGQHRDQGAGDVRLSGRVITGDATGGAGQVGVQDFWGNLAGVALFGQPGAQAFGGEPVGLVLGGEPGQERQGDLGVEVGEQAHRPGEDVSQVGAQLVGGRDPV